MKIILISAGILFFASALWFFSADDSIKNYPPREGGIVVFGDSLVEGVGAPAGSDFVSLLSQKINEPIINMGVSGDTTADGLVRVDEVIEENPRMVLVLLGGNDYLRRIPPEETFQNLRQIILKIQENGAVTVLLGVRGGILRDGFGSSFEALAEETDSVYVEDVLDGIFGNAKLMSDGIHPNADGYARIAEKVYEGIEEVLK